MKSTIIKGLNEREVQEMEANWRASKLVRQRLQAITKEKTETERASVRGKDAFKEPSWAYHSAYALGYEKALDEIFKLLDDTSVE